MSLQEFGKYFAQIRISSGYASQRQLAMDSGISNGTIARIESGVQKASPETLRTLSEYLKNTSYVELMVRAGYWDEEELLEPLKDAVINEAPSQYEAKKEPANIDERLLEIKELANELGMDLSDPKTINTIKDALNLIKRARG